MLRFIQRISTYPAKYLSFIVKFAHNNNLISEVLKMKCINTLGPWQNGRHFADDMLKCIFLNENVWIPIEISLKFYPKVPINNILALIQIMAWHRSGDKPLSQPMIYWRIYASLGLNELRITKIVNNDLVGIAKTFSFNRNLVNFHHNDLVRFVQSLYNVCLCAV